MGGSLMPLYLIPDRHGRRIETMESSTLASAIQHASIYHADRICQSCRGTGRNPMSDTVNWLPCAACGGRGEIKPAPAAIPHPGRCPTCED